LKIFSFQLAIYSGQKHLFDMYMYENYVYLSGGCMAAPAPWHTSSAVADALFAMMGEQTDGATVAIGF
jgi:hypothetical protein